MVWGQYFSHKISPLAFCYQVDTSHGPHGMSRAQCWRHRVMRQDGIPTLQEWFWYLISALLKLLHTPPGCLLLWFDRHICHWVHAIWGHHVTVRAMSPMSQTVILSLEHTIWKALSLLCWIQRLPLLSELLTLGFRRGASALHSAPKYTVLRLPRSFLKALKEHQTMWCWIDLLKLGLGALTTRELLSLGRPASTFSVPYLPTFSNWTVRCIYLTLNSK